jgi:sugar transferase (PEP-CTERM/EpsH1 system associated)
VVERAAESRFDLVYVSSTPMAQYARRLGAPVIMDFVDVDSDKWRQYSEHRRPPVSWLYRAEGRRLQSAEGEIARWAKLCLLATSAEEALLRSFAPWARTAILQNGIGLDEFRPMERAAAPAAVIFTGAMDYLPNIDAVRHFCDEVLPRIRQRIPETRFYIVGLNPSREVQRLAEIAGVVVTGTVPDVRPYYARAAVCVAPLRIGRGVQNKVLQAMAMGLPVVASTIAQRGLEAEAGRHLHVEDDPERFAARVVTLLRSPEARQTMGQLGRAFVEAHHAWDTACGRLDGMIRSVVRAETVPIGSSA